jgi:hypothetical protein
MKHSNPNSSLTIALVLGSLAVLGWLCSQALADDYPPRPLPDDDRQTLNEYLGNNVVGESISAPALPHGLNDLISLRDGIAWRMRVISGKGQGSEQQGSAGMLSRPDDSTRFRFDTGDGRNVLYGQLDPKGNLICYASQDNQEGVISRFTPGQPIFLADIAPGEVRKATSNVSVADLSRPDVETHSGKLDIEFTYLGAYRLRVPAGTIDAVLVKTRLTGKVGPADVQDTIYRFFAKNSGLVATVETEDVSAVLIYHEKTRVGKVLVETIVK